MKKGKEIFMRGVFLLAACASVFAVAFICVFLFANGVPQILEEMIYNLCDNAVKYNRPNGNATVSLKKLRDNGVELSVKDTGIGIPFADRDRVFERFYRVNKSHSKEVGGTGLGLSIVKHGALFHQASIRLDSVEKEGATVTILFPAPAFQP